MNFLFNFIFLYYLNFFISSHSMPLFMCSHRILCLVYIFTEKSARLTRVLQYCWTVFFNFISLYYNNYFIFIFMLLLYIFVHLKFTTEYFATIMTLICMHLFHVFVHFKLPIKYFSTIMTQIFIQLFYVFLQNIIIFYTIPQISKLYFSSICFKFTLY